METKKRNFQVGEKTSFHETPLGIAVVYVYLYQAAILCRDDGLSGAGEF